MDGKEHLQKKIQKLKKAIIADSIIVIILLFLSECFMKHSYEISTAAGISVFQEFWFIWLVYRLFTSASVILFMMIIMETVFITRIHDNVFKKMRTVKISQFAIHLTLCLYFMLIYKSIDLYSAFIGIYTGFGFCVPFLAVGAVTSIIFEKPFLESNVKFPLLLWFATIFPIIDIAVLSVLCRKTEN